MGAAMEHGEFQREVIEKLAQIDTKLTIAVGSNGDGGKMADLDDRMREVERDRDTEKGRRQVLGWVRDLASAVIGGAVATLLGWMRHGHG